jgi:hypothetical protein
VKHLVTRYAVVDSKTLRPVCLSEYEFLRDAKQKAEDCNGSARVYRTGDRHVVQERKYQLVESAVVWTEGDEEEKR